MPKFIMLMGESCVPCIGVLGGTGVKVGEAIPTGMKLPN